MRILQISTADVGGGAEEFGRKLHKEYLARGHKSWLAVGRKNSADPDIVLIPNATKRSRYFRSLTNLHRNLRAKGHKSKFVSAFYRLAYWRESINEFLGRENFYYPGTSEIFHLLDGEPEIIHCHNLHGQYFDLRALANWNRNYPIVFTLHDSWMLSGHCAYSLDCDRWKIGCGNCPDLTLAPAIKRDATAFNFKQKQRIYQDCRFHIATPSRWLADKVSQSMLAPHAEQIRVIPNGIDLSVFHPSDRLKARQDLGLPQDAWILLTVASFIRTNQYKDYATLLRTALLLQKNVPQRKSIFLGIGETGGEKPESDAIKHVSFINDPVTLAKYYQAADVYVHSAKAENYPTTILEALACGIPVVAARVGGIPEQVRLESNPTGILVPSQHPEALAEAVTSLLQNESLRIEMGLAASSDAKARFNFKENVNAYLSWYEEILMKRKTRIA